MRGKTDRLLVLKKKKTNKRHDHITLMDGLKMTWTLWFVVIR